MKKDVREAMRRVVDYDWAAEQRDWEHVIRTVLVVIPA